jgi:hypothetical protein
MSDNAKEKSTLIQMRLQPKSMQRINDLTDLTGIRNRTQLIANSIELTEELVKNAKDGAKIYIERKDGTRELIKIVGLM